MKRFGIIAFMAALCLSVPGMSPGTQHLNFDFDCNDTFVTLRTKDRELYAIRKEHIQQVYRPFIPESDPRPATILSQR